MNKRLIYAKPFVLYIDEKGNNKYIKYSENVIIIIDEKREI